MSEPIALAHPDDVLSVFEHSAVWIEGNAMKVEGRSSIPRGRFRVVDGNGAFSTWYDVPAAPAPTVSHRCARCNATLDEASVEGHGGRCFVVGDEVRWQVGERWHDGTVAAFFVHFETRDPMVTIDAVRGYTVSGYPFRSSFSVKNCRRFPLPRHGSPAPSTPPSPTLYDGLDSMSCWLQWSDNRACLERGAPLMYEMTPAQITAAKGRQFAISEQHSEQLRARIDAARERERAQVQMPDDDAWLANCRDAE